MQNKQTHHRCLVADACTVSIRAHTLTPPALRTVEQPQACLISGSFMVGPLQKARTHTLYMYVPGRSSMHCLHPSTHLQSASTSHRRAAARLLDQAKLHGGSIADRTHCRCLVAVAKVCALHLSVRCRVGHAPSVRIRLAPSSSRTFARPVGASWRLHCRSNTLQVPGRGCGDKHSPLS